MFKFFGCWPGFWTILCGGGQHTLIEHTGPWCYPPFLQSCPDTYNCPLALSLHVLFFRVSLVSKFVTCIFSLYGSSSQFFCSLNWLCSADFHMSFTETFIRATSSATLRSVNMHFSMHLCSSPFLQIQFLENFFFNGSCKNHNSLYWPKINTNLSKHHFTCIKLNCYKTNFFFF